MSTRHGSLTTTVSAQTSKTRPSDSSATLERRSSSADKHRRHPEASVASVGDATTCLINTDSLLIEDDVFYRTVRRHPSWPESDPEVSLTFVRPSELVGTERFHNGGEGERGGGKEKTVTGLKVGCAKERKKSLSVEKRSDGTKPGLRVTYGRASSNTARVESTKDRWKSVSPVPHFL